MAEIRTGLHAIEESVKNSRTNGTLYISKKSKRLNSIVAMAKKTQLKVREISAREMDNMFPGIDHRGIVLELEYSGEDESVSLDAALKGVAEDTALVLLLDGITDPHNYGAILRSSDQFSVDFVVTPSRRSVKENQTVVRTSAGASEYVTSVIVPNLSRVIDRLKEEGFWVYGADMNGGALMETGLEGKVAIVMGSEGKGLSRLIREKCDAFVSIPSKGNIDSLNVSVATGIILYEVRRQQGFFNSVLPE